MNYVSLVPSKLSCYIGSIWQRADPLDVNGQTDYKTLHRVNVGFAKGFVPPNKNLDISGVESQNG